MFEKIQSIQDRHHYIHHRPQDEVLILLHPLRQREAKLGELIFEPVHHQLVGIFPNVEAAQRLLEAVIMEIDEEWTTGHKYLDMTEYWAWRQGLSKQGEVKREEEMHSEAA